jgi:C4-dicarboxylate-specific signal transduction histidine kinase
MVLLGCGSLLLAGSAAGEGHVRQVLLVHSYGSEFAPFSQTSAAFRAELSRISPQPVEFLETSLEMARFDGIEREEPLVTYLESLFDGRKPDLVVPFGAPALMFCHRNRERLFPAVPILATGADKRRVSGLEEDPWITSVHFETDLPALALGIRRLLPDLRHLHVVAGTAPVDRFWEEQLRREWPPVLDGVKIHWLSDKALPEIRDELARLPARSAVIYGIMTRDAAGVSYEHDSALTKLRPASRAPVFGFAEEHLGAGTVGGSLMGTREGGRIAAGVAIRLLAGESPAAIDTPSIKPGPPQYNWRELKHWNIPLSRLPANSTILYRPPGLWQSHRTIVLVTMAALALQSVWIVLLVAARRRARESGENLRLAVDAAQVGIFRHEIGNSDEIHGSSKWRDLFDLPGTGPLHIRDVFERIHPEDHAMVRESMDRALQTGRESEIDYRMVRGDGELRWVSSRWRAERGKHRNIVRTRGASIDITARKRAEAEHAARREELARLHRVATLGELSGALAHELNQPLGSILSNAQAAMRLLSRKEITAAEFHEILGDIVTADQRAAAVIKRLRALFEQREATPQALDPHQCIREVLALLEPDMKQREMIISCRFADKLPRVHADPIQLQQVILNLFGNAMDACAGLPPDERRISVRTGSDGDHVFVEVEDNGTGFSAAPEESFQPFHTTKPGGMGMGLAVCKAVITAHHGTITAVSPPGGGAMVRFTLPCAPSS